MMRGMPAQDELSAAELAGVVFATDPARFGGVVLRGMPGPVRERWRRRVQHLVPGDVTWRKVPVSVSAERLLGGLDYAATLAAGRPVVAEGLLANIDGGVAELAMAERVPVSIAAMIAAALDAGEVVLERDGFARRFAARFGVVALDEGIEDDERLDAALADRLAFRVELADLDAAAVAFTGLDPAMIEAARERLPRVIVPDAVVRALAGTALAFGIESLRADLFAIGAARVLAALRGAAEVGEADATLAAQMVLAHRARCFPAEAEAPDETPQDERTPDRPPEDAADDGERPETLDDVVLAATRAAVPAGLLAQARDLAGRQGASTGRGRAGPEGRRMHSGRPIGSVSADRVRGGRVNLLATLKAAAPWQSLRRAGARADRKLVVEKRDLQVTRFKDKNETTTVFVVDASGSQAAARLGEVKGAIELLLAECYVRRDEVALIAFRGSDAEVVMPPTRALARARRTLADVPAGGGTPLAAGIDRAREMVAAVRRQGRTPVVVFLTDGRGNVARDGSKGHERAASDARAAARLFRGTGVRPVLVDTSRRPRAAAETLARELCASYLPMPHPSAEAINAALSIHIAA